MKEILSRKFEKSYACFQLVMLCYNIWCYLKIMEQACIDMGSKNEVYCFIDSDQFLQGDSYLYKDPSIGTETEP